VFVMIGVSGEECSTRALSQRVNWTRADAR